MMNGSSFRQGFAEANAQQERGTNCSDKPNSARVAELNQPHYSVALQQIIRYLAIKGVNLPSIEGQLGTGPAKS